MDKADIVVGLCIFLGIGLVLLGLRWFLFGPPDPTEKDERGNRPPWD
jgi:hypothetical protein